MEICNHAQPEGGDLEYTYDPEGLHMENHWGVQPQVEYFNPRGGKVACQGKDTRSKETYSGNTHVGVAEGEPCTWRHLAKRESCRWHNSGVDVWRRLT